ncbi:MAG: DNA-3-methyladenine glycosylase [Alkalispirochaeta sp.]
MRETVRRARELIGSQLVVIDAAGGRCGGRIVETEAYCADDPASHSYRGRTPRNGSMFLAAGHIYVYRSYGVHWCLNVVTAAAGVGEAVLIRAIEPLWGVDEMYRRRGLEPNAGGVNPRLTNGPGKLCQALGITGELDGVDLTDPAATLQITPDSSPGTAEDNSATPDNTSGAISSGPRIGISKNAEVPWRFTLTGSRFLSRRFLSRR